MNRKWGIRGVLLTLAAWVCWQGMESFPDYSTPSTALYYSGNLLIVLALYALYQTFRGSRQ